MKKIILILTVCILTTNDLFSQDFNLKWSERFEYENSKDGFFSNYINTNDNYIYALHTNLDLKSTGKSKKIRLVCFDKQTMEKIASIPLKGYKENAATKSDYKNLEYHKTIVGTNEIFVFWIDRSAAKSDKKEVLYCESFDVNLKKDKKLKKIYTANLPQETKISRYSSTATFVLSNREAGDEIVVGHEIQKKDDNIDFSYCVIDAELSELTKNQVELPVNFKSNKSLGLSSSYELGKDGNIYIKSFVSMSKEERKNAKKGEAFSYCILSAVKPESGELSKITLKENSRNINDFSYVIDKNKVRIYGFFCDIDKDPTGNSSHGLFFTEAEAGSFDDASLGYTYFDKKTIESLFSKDKEDKKKTPVFGKKKKAKAVENDAEALDDRFEIEDMFTVENDVVLFCSKMYNYSVTTCTTNSNGGQSCTTRYYCEKSNVVAIRVNNEGEIEWATNIDRKKTYSGTSIYDLNVVFANNKFYTIFGSDYQADAEKKSRKSRKRLKDFRDQFEYAVFDYDTGSAAKNTFMVNQKNDIEKKSVDPLAITVLDGRFYVDYSVIKQKWGPTIPVCIASLACPYLVIIPMMNGSFKKGYGNLGVLTIIESNTGKDPKKKDTKVKETKPMDTKTNDTKAKPVKK